MTDHLFQGETGYSILTASFESYLWLIGWFRLKINFSVIIQKKVYDGDWRDDLQNGFGTIYFPNGDMYEGHWKGGKKHGDGEFHFQSRGQILKGTWSEGISKCGELFEMKDKTKGIVPEVNA